MVLILFLCRSTCHFDRFEIEFEIKKTNVHSSACGTCLLIRFINFKMVWKTIDLTHSKWHLLIIIDTGIEYEIWIHTLRTKLLNTKVHMHAINGHCYVQYKADHTSMLTSVNRLPKYLWYSDLCKIAAFFSLFEFTAFFHIWIHGIFFTVWIHGIFFMVSIHGIFFKFKFMTCFFQLCKFTSFFYCVNLCHFTLSKKYHMPDFKRKKKIQDAHSNCDRKMVSRVCVYYTINEFDLM